MKLLVDEGWSIKQIAELYHVTQFCVRYNTDSIFRGKNLDDVNTRKKNNMKII